MSKKILVVDDEKGIVQLLEDVLKSSGYEVDAAFDGEEGLQKAQSGTYDLILLDLNLPKRDGQSICMELKMDSKTEQIPIIMLTSRNDAKEKEIGEKVGAEAYIPKPFDIQELMAAVNKILAAQF